MSIPWFTAIGTSHGEFMPILVRYILTRYPSNVYIIEIMVQLSCMAANTGIHVSLLLAWSLLSFILA